MRFRQRKTDVLVHFFGAADNGSYGWVIPTNVKSFDPASVDDHMKVKNKTLRAAIACAVVFCERVARGDDGEIWQSDDRYIYV